MKKICICGKRTINSFHSCNIIPFRRFFVKKKSLQGREVSLPCRNRGLLHPEGLAVSAGVHSGIHFVGTHQNPLQRAVVFVVAVMGTLLDSALNGLVGMAVHKRPPFDLDSGIVWPQRRKPYWKTFPMLLFPEKYGILYLPVIPAS